MTNLAITGHELIELRSEVERHHKDFAKISELCGEALDMGAPYCADPIVTLKRIRRIVG